MPSWESRSGCWLSCARAGTGSAQAASRMRGEACPRSDVRSSTVSTSSSRHSTGWRSAADAAVRLAIPSVHMKRRQVARRAFCAVQKYAAGLRGRPPLQGIPRASTRSKAKATRQGSVSVSARSSGRAFRSRPCSILRDRDGWQAAALSSETKYYRVIRWTIRDQDRW